MGGGFGGSLYGTGKAGGRGGSGGSFGSPLAGGAYNLNPSGTGSSDDRNKGSKMSMQDMLGAPVQEIEMQDLSGNSLFTSDDPLNTGFYDPNTGGDKDE